MGDLRIGTSGWHYPSGRGTWNGVFYPRTRGRAKGFDELEFYSSRFNTVEVNSTFYGQPRAEVTGNWARRTPRHFEFAIKLYQKFTHPRMFADRVVRDLRVDRPSANLVAALAQPLDADVDEFKRGIEPLANAGKLGVILVQFPASFRSGSHEHAYLRGLLAAFSAYTMAVELRHKSWSDASDQTRRILAEFQAAWVQIDEPKFPLSIRQNLLPNVTATYYLRLHGRNAAQWWQHSNAEDRYNYFYTPAELEEFSTALTASSALVKKAYLFTNNHFSAQSVANAAMIKHQVGQRVEGSYPDSFIERFPELAGIVSRDDATVSRPHGRQRQNADMFEPD